MTFHLGSTDNAIPSSNASCAGGVSYSAAQPALLGSVAAEHELFFEEHQMSDETGCIAIARSSAPPRPAPPGDAMPPGANLEFYAFALDAVAPSSF